MLVITKAFIIVAFALFALPAKAALVFPTVFDVAINPGSSQTYQIAIKNTELSDKKYTIDFIGVELGENEGDYFFNDLDPDLASWFPANINEFSLVAQEERLIDITISSDANAIPQLFVAGVRITEESTQNGQISVNSGIVSLAFITVDGANLFGEYEKSFETNTDLLIGEVYSHLTITNKAEKVVQPVGSVECKNVFGLVSDSSDINVESKRVPNGQTRTFSAKCELDWGFGLYFVDVNATAWEGDVIEASDIVWVFSLKSILLVVALLLFCIITWRYARKH